MIKRTAQYMAWVGSHSSTAKAKSSRANGALGGRPAGVRETKPRRKRMNIIRPIVLDDTDKSS